MIDLHCHILPGVDDGSDSLDTSCRMAAIAADSGVRQIVATPHRGIDPARESGGAAAIRTAVSALQRELDRWNIPVRILPGSELLLAGDWPLPAPDSLLSLNGSRYLLVEFYFDESPRAMERRLRAVEEAGFVPVVAHPERYFCVQEQPSIADVWVDRGRVLQLNKGSLLGSLGEEACLCASLLLRRGLASVIASDAHHSRVRTPDMRNLLELLSDRFPAVEAELLLLENPRRILRDLPLS
jgi:protein-tyrosine phosphatase